MYRRVALAAVLSTLPALAWSVNREDVPVLEEVGTLSQPCATGKEASVFDAANRKVVLSVDEETDVRLPRLTSEFHWYCGSKIVRASSAEVFNLARAERDDEGGVSWTFLIEWSR